MYKPRRNEVEDKHTRVTSRYKWACMIRPGDQVITSIGGVAAVKMVSGFNEGHINMLIQFGEQSAWVKLRAEDWVQMVRLEDSIELELADIEEVSDA
jgi:hypothetical protein